MFFDNALTVTIFCFLLIKYRFFVSIIFVVYLHPPRARLAYFTKVVPPGLENRRLKNRMGGSQFLPPGHVHRTEPCDCACDRSLCCDIQGKAATVCPSSMQCTDR